MWLSRFQARMPLRSRCCVTANASSNLPDKYEGHHVSRNLQCDSRNNRGISRDPRGIGRKRRGVSLDAARIYRALSGVMRNGAVISRKRRDESGNLPGDYRDPPEVMKIPLKGRA